MDQAPDNVRAGAAPRFDRKAPHVLVIGGGPAGLRAAVDLADLGVRATVVERSSATGGTPPPEGPTIVESDCACRLAPEPRAGHPWWAVLAAVAAFGSGWARRRTRP